MVSIEKIQNHKRANDIAIKLGFEGVEHFKMDWCQKEHISGYNLGYDKDANNEIVMK